MPRGDRPVRGSPVLCGARRGAAPRPALLPVFALVCAGVGAAVGVETVSQEDGEPDVHAIVVEAVERMDEALQAVAGDYRALVTSESREFDGRGEVEEETRVEWESVPIDGARFSRRIAIDGRPLTEEERARESGREAAFRERLRRLRAGEIEPERNENQIIFDEELVARYDMTLEGEEPFRNRPSYRIAFTPRAGDLPVRRQIERALNKARGRVWVDRETHEIARLEFELIDSVRLWWGLVGTIHRFRGSLDRGPVLDGRWANLQSESYSDVPRLLQPLAAGFAPALAQLRVDRGSATAERPGFRFRRNRLRPSRIPLPQNKPRPLRIPLPRKKARGELVAAAATPQPA